MFRKLAFVAVVAMVVGCEAKLPVTQTSTNVSLGIPTATVEGQRVWTVELEGEQYYLTHSYAGSIHLCPKTPSKPKKAEAVDHNPFTTTDPEVQRKSTENTHHEWLKLLTEMQKSLDERVRKLESAKQL